MFSCKHKLVRLIQSQVLTKHTCGQNSALRVAVLFSLNLSPRGYWSYLKVSYKCKRIEISVQDLWGFERGEFARDVARIAVEYLQLSNTVVGFMSHIQHRRLSTEIKWLKCDDKCKYCATHVTPEKILILVFSKLMAFLEPNDLLINLQDVSSCVTISFSMMIRVVVLTRGILYVNILARWFFAFSIDFFFNHFAFLSHQKQFSTLLHHHLNKGKKSKWNFY